MSQVRIGAVGYLNARPLTWALDREPDRWIVRYDVPSVCASLLHEGDVDLGLIPSIEYLQSEQYRFVPGVGIGSRGTGGVGGALHAEADRGDPSHRARHELADVGHADPGALPPPFPYRPELRAARTRSRRDDVGLRRRPSDWRSRRSMPSMTRWACERSIWVRSGRR